MPLGNRDGAQWQVVFICPACGLITPFDAARASAGVRIVRGSKWAAELREFGTAPQSEDISHLPRATSRNFVATFALAFIVWILLIGNFNWPEVLWGIIVALLTARLTYRFAVIDLPYWITEPRRWLALVQLALEFARQIIVQNVTLSIRVLRPSLPIRPGIVAIPTTLRGDVALTILGSLMTLTPDTVTVDIDQRRGIIYVHWIDVQTTDPVEVQKLISADLEEKLRRWLV
jgi:multicomponent Na+:H+ antiporter subunit E